ITPAMKAASGVCARSYDTVLPTLVDLGVLTRTRHPSQKHRGRRWYDYTLVGSALNGQLHTVGQTRARDRVRVSPGMGGASSDRAAFAALQRELEELRTWKQRHERCWVCGTALAGPDHVHAPC